MENKKQLIIVPPMSQALQKLNEILEGIASDENIDISLIDDLKELGQVLSNSGQCLILCSNPKKCATFLQENRFVISRFHSKTILLTPHEIPPKTMVKFTKVGLTESILENSPPKTLLYKIKLQLRSIKSSSISEEKEKEKEIIKSMIDINAGQNTLYEEEKIKELPQTNAEATPEEDKKVSLEADAENAIHYASNYKGKMSPQEETIDTHWKTQRKTTEVTLDLFEGEKKKDFERNHDDIDLYYRGNAKKNNNFTIEEEDIYSKKKTLSNEESITEAERKKSNYRDVIEEDIIRQKSSYREDVSDKNSPVEIKPGDNDISIEMEKPDKASDLVDLEYSNEMLTKTKGQIELDITAGGQRKKETLNHDEEKPQQEKISTANPESAKIDDASDEANKEYDNSDSLEKKKKFTELELLEAKKRKQLAQEQESLDKSKRHQDSLELQEKDIKGELPTEHIDTYMRSEKKPLSPDKSSESESNEKNNGNTDNSYEDEENLTPNKLTAINLANEKQEKESDGHDSIDIEYGRHKHKESLKSDNSDKARNEEMEEQDAHLEYERQAVLSINEIDIDLIKKEKEKNQALEEKEIGLKKLGQTHLDLKTDKKTNSEGLTEKIDTYYRGGDAQKNNQNWDFEQDKKQAELALLRNKKGEISLGSSFQTKDNGEITIDYRKLKEEFDLISKGEYVADPDSKKNSANGNIDPEDEGTFRVIEINTKGLDLSVNLLNMIYQKNIKAKQIYAYIAEDILAKYDGITVFWEYKLSSKKHDEVYNSYLELVHAEITSELKDWWPEYKKDKDLFEHFQSRTMNSWRCPQIMDKNIPWEDVELPTWAKNELADKTVELAFPYFDGVDRMGLALVVFHKGLKSEHEHSILTSLEMARHLLLETIQRSSGNPSSYLNEQNESEDNKNQANNKVLNFFGGLFGKKKAG